MVPLPTDIPEDADYPARDGAIRVAAAIVSDGAGRTLVARSRGTTPFMQPGGKLDEGETPRQAMVRELREEIGVEVDPATASWVGRFEAPAANHPGRVVVGEIFAVTVDPAKVEARAEVEEVAWFDPTRPTALELAPLTVLLLPHARPARTTRQ
jgi:8-oxo-dGTP pyrophosphatase MutT (NUDIX family)